MRDTMPFGKYKGELLSDIPDEYLEWVLDNTDPLPKLRSNIIKEQERRRYENEAKHRQDMNRVSTETALAIVESGRRTLASKFHPDKGGNAELMTEINATADWLIRNIELMAMNLNKQERGHE